MLHLFTFGSITGHSSLSCSYSIMFLFFSGTFVQIKFSNCIWNMDSRSMALSQTIYMFHRVRMIYTERAPSSLLLLSFEIRWEKKEKTHTHSWYFRDLYAIIYYILCSVQENDSEKRYIAGLLVFFRPLLLSGCILIVLPSFSLCACVCAYAFVQFHIDVLVFWS